MKYYGFSQEKAQEAIGRYREYFADKGIFENIKFPYFSSATTFSRAASASSGSLS